MEDMSIGEFRIRPFKTEFKRLTKYNSMEEEIIMNLMYSYKLIVGEMDRFFKHNHLSGAQFEALKIIHDIGDSGIRIRKIPDLMASNNPDVTRIVDRLEKSGLVQRERDDEDRRVVTVAITETGKKVLIDLQKKVMDLHKQQLGHLQQSEMQSYVDMLTKLRDRPQ